MLKLRLFGGLAADLDGRSLDLPRSRRARSLLAWLAVNPGLHARSTIAQRFWPDVSDASARNSLRQALWALRRSLGEAAAELEGRNGRIGLAATVWCDVAQMELLASAGQLEQAVELCTGDLLADLDDDWVPEARDAYHERVAQLYARLASDAAASGDREGALRWTRRRLTLDPLSEDAVAALMERLMIEGDRAGALAAYGRYADRLRRAIAVAPSPSLRTRAAELRTGDRMPLVLSASRPPLAPALVLPTRSAFAGRQAELAALKSLWRMASEGRPAMAMIVGEPGIGKTRLACEFAKARFEQGASVLFGRCEEEAPAPFQPFAQALAHDAEHREPTALREAIGAWAGELVRLVPALQRYWEDLPRPVQAGPDSERRRLFEAVAGYLRAAAANSPVLVVLEDLHWADTGTVLLLRHLWRSLEGARVMLIGTYRHTEVAASDHLLRSVAAIDADAFERLALRGLAEDELAQVIAAWTGARAQAGVARAVHERSAGNPFFAVELLRAIEEHVGSTEREWTHDSVAATTVPDLVRDVIEQRLERLALGVRKALAVASACGEQFDVDVLAATLGDTDRGIDGLLQPACAGGFVIETPSPVGRYAFAHALIRDTAYRGMSAVTRCELHERIGLALERLLESGRRVDPADLAWHFSQAAAGNASLTSRAAGYARHAGDQALEQLAYEDAATHYEQALKMLAHSADLDARERCRLLTALGEARARAADRRASAVFAEAVDEARNIDDGELFARATLASCGIGVSLLAVREHHGALIEEALERLADTLPDLRARLLARLAIERYYTDPPASDALSTEAVIVARGTDDVDALLTALSARHVALWTPDALDERLAIADELIALGNRSGRREHELQGHNWRAIDLWERGAIDAFEAEATTHAALADELRLPSYRWYRPFWEASLKALRGEAAAAEQSLVEARALGEQAGDPNARLLADVTSIWLKLMSRRYSPELLATIESYLAQAAPGAEGAWRTARAHCLGELGRLHECRTELDNVAHERFSSIPRNVNWLPAVPHLVEVVARLHDTRRASELYDLVRPYAGRLIVIGRGGIALATVHYAVARLATVAGRHETAVEHFEAALNAEHALGARLWLIRTRSRYAELLAAHPDPGNGRHATALAEQAVSDADDLDLREAVPPEVRAIGLHRTQSPGHA